MDLAMQRIDQQLDLLAEYRQALITATVTGQLDITAESKGPGGGGGLMPGVHTESAFEQAIEAHLLANGYIQGSKSDYDASLALDPVQLFAFVEATQPDEWAQVAEEPWRQRPCCVPEAADGGVGGSWVAGCVASWCEGSGGDDPVGVLQAGHPGGSGVVGPV